ncbi:MAG: CHAT domain-containing protein [Kofleriaceae bacterium]
MTSFRVDWCAGPNVQIELFEEPAAQGLGFRYTPRFRATLRPPVEVLPLTEMHLRSASQGLKELTVMASTLRSAARDLAAPGSPMVEGPFEWELHSLGGLLYDLVMTDAARNDLRPANCFIDFGVGERMQHFPWELMHDGEEFICLKHSFGRFVAGAAASPGLANPKAWFGDSLPTLSVLVISVPQPQPRADSRQTYPPLRSAELETQAIVRTLSAIGNVEVTVLAGKDATGAAVTNALRRGRFQIIHYCGHASYNETQPLNSALVLWDADLPAGVAQRLFVRAQPVLCFVNACETARLPDEGALNVYSLARAFLDTGAYLIGSRWKLDDHAASTFASSFYEELLGQGAALGNAMRAGRLAARTTIASDHLGWGAYVLYGDPRLCFRRD